MISGSPRVTEVISHLEIEDCVKVTGGGGSFWMSSPTLGNAVR